MTFPNKKTVAILYFRKTASLPIMHVPAEP